MNPQANLQRTFLLFATTELLTACAVAPLQPMGAAYVLAEDDFKNALALAQQRDGGACYQLHLHYSIGLGEHREGFAWLRRSAEYGSPIGMCGYGVSLWNTAENDRQKDAAKRWVRKAAAAGDADAIEYLARYMNVSES